MNPKKEFINAIMSVLRLEQNIYVTASIEEIIDRIDTKDYTIFMAFLGERDGDYEKPIQTIAKATDEFYEKINKPKRIASLKIVEETERRFKEANYLAVEKFKKPKEEDPYRFTVNKDDVRELMIEKVLPQGKDFYIDGETEPYSYITDIVDRCGGVELLVDLFIDDFKLFSTKVRNESGYNKYNKPSIADKVDGIAEDGIDKNILSHVRSALTNTPVIR